MTASPTWGRFGLIVAGAFPFFVVVLGMIGLMMAFPGLATFLPRP